MLNKYRINTRQKLDDFIEDIANMWVANKYVIATLSDKRTLPQNSLKSVFYKEISDRRADSTPKDIERECKLNYGIPILRRREMETWLYERTIDKLNYEQKLKIMDTFKVTSDMSVDELKEYMSTMQSDYPFLGSNKG